MAKDKRDSEFDDRGEMDDGEVVIRKRQQVVRKNVTREDVLKAVSTMIGVMRDKQHPLVQTYSDAASAPFTAACTLAAGARAVSIGDTGDAAQLSLFAEGLSASLGGLSKQCQDTLRAAVGQSVARARPWVLGAEGVDMLSSRRFFAKEISKRLPGLIMGTPAEIAAMEGSGEPSSVEGDLEKAALEVAGRLALETHATVIVTGAADTIVCEDRPSLKIGCRATALAAKVPGWAAAKAALAASYLALLRNHKYAAAASMCLVSAVAADVALERASTPAAFASAYVDALASITPDDLAKRADVTVLEC